MFINPTVDLDRVALEAPDGRTKTYGQLEAGALSLKGILHPDKLCILLLADRSVEALSMYYYCLANRDVPFAMDENTAPVLLQTLCSRYQFPYIFCHKSKNGHFPNCQPVHKMGEYNLLASGCAPVAIHNCLATLISTSGTTGSVKSVRITYDNWLATTDAAARFYQARPDDTGILIPPLCYCFGQIFVLTQFKMGAKILVTNHNVFEPEFWEFFDRSSVNCFFCVPYTTTQLKRLGFFETDRPSLRYICQGGGKSDSATEMAFLNGPLNAHCQFYLAYGQTEAVIISSAPKELILSKPGSVGYALAHVSAQIKDDLPEGELVITGGTVTFGYAQGKDELCRGDDFGGTLNTGDIGRIDENGCLFLSGRASRFSKIAGLRVSHDEIENIAKAAYKDIDVACVGNDSHIAVAVAGLDDLTNLRKYICACIHINKRYIGVYGIDSIPLLPNGKIDYKLLMKNYL